MAETLPWLDHLLLSVDDVLELVTAYLPTLASALLLLLAGWLLARLIKALVLRIGNGLGNVLQRAGFWQKVHFVRLPWPVSLVFGNLLYWIVIFIFLASAASQLGLPGVSVWVDSALRVLPKLVSAAGILIVGFIAASLARDAAPIPQLARALFLTLNTIAVLVAADELGVDVVLLQQIVTILIGVLFAGAALAFGLGAGGTVNNIVAAHYLRRTYRPGQRVRVGEIEGVILEIAQTAVMLDTVTGRAMVPARVFASRTSLLLDDETDGNDL
ncbi:MAG: hypothetical protein H6978_01895 [Gammaproteobacteria bacterium]|nr:hypothetical protein [Gammaproteobacteria bacterium]